MEKKAALEQTLKPNWGGQKSCQKRLDIIDVMQGIAMLWVIVGYHLFDFMPPVYGHIHYYIYSFHMPLFIFISGFLIAYSYKGISYRQYVYRRFHKFFVPYVIVGIIITLLAATKSGIASIGENLVNLVVSPKQSEATFLWYIYLLFVQYHVPCNPHTQAEVAFDCNIIWTFVYAIINQSLWLVATSRVLG